MIKRIKQIKDKIQLWWYKKELKRCIAQRDALGWTETDQEWVCFENEWYQTQVDFLKDKIEELKGRKALTKVNATL